jgi:hypothetical protein
MKQRKDSTGSPPNAPHLRAHTFATPSPRARTKNKSEIRGKFSRTKTQPSSNHDSPRIHHKFTIEKPRSTTRFRQNPLQKPQNRLPPKKCESQVPIQGRAIPNTNGSLISSPIQIIVEVGGRSNDEVHTNSNRASALRIIFRDIQSFDWKRTHSRHQNRPASRRPILPAARRSGVCPPINVPRKLPVLALLLPLFRQKR